MFRWSLKTFHFIGKKLFDRFWTREGSQSLTSSDFNKQGFKWKLNTSDSCLNFCLLFAFFFTSTLFRKINCFLPTYIHQSKNLRKLHPFLLFYRKLFITLIIRKIQWNCRANSCTSGTLYLQNIVWVSFSQWSHEKIIFFCGLPLWRLSWWYRVNKWCIKGNAMILPI